MPRKSAAKTPDATEGASAESSIDAMTRRTREATQAKAEPGPAPAQTLAEADRPRRTRRTRKSAAAEAPAAEAAEAAAPAAEPRAAAPAAEAKGEDAKDASSEAAPRPKRTGRKKAAEDAPAAEAPAAEAAKQANPAEDAKGAHDAKEKAPAPAPQHAQNQGQQNQQNHSQGQGRNHGNFNQQGQGHNQRRNRYKNRREQMPAEPSLSREELQEMKVVELRERARELGLDYLGVRKADLVESIYQKAAALEGFRDVTGILDIVPEGYGFIRTGNYMPGDMDAFVPQAMIRQQGLRRGDLVSGSVRPSRPNDRYPALSKIASVNGLDPQLAALRPRFRDLTPIFPDERLKMETTKEATTGRAIDIVAPIGKGQRGLIVSPPKAGKTTILKRICQAISRNNPEVHLICLLVDERPEEVTDMERSIKGDVVASTFDMPADNHTQVAELVIERAKRLVEQGEDVVVVLDSITRLARAYNLAAPPSGRILSGGVDSAALYPPKRFLGAARNIEGGGSLTIIASALIDTGSKMDEVIFEEFKGTGNMELKLDRGMADKRIFPAIDPVASGTRNEDRLIDPTLAPLVWGLRRVLANMNNVERAEASLIKGLQSTPNNQDFLVRSARKAARTDYSD